MKIHKQIGLCLLIGAVAIAGFGCRKHTGPLPPSATQDQILVPNLHTSITQEEIQFTPVYASSFGDTIILAINPVDEWDSQKSDCPPREISNGGRIRCNGDHEEEVPITKVIIWDDMIPRVCAGWFRDMTQLESIEGLHKIHTHEVHNMSYMFAGCGKLETLDLSSWDVSNVTDMTGMFQDCVSLEALPEWYE